MAVNHGLYLGFDAKPWQGIETISATQQHPLGAFFDDQYGRRFRYALNGAGALVAGDLVQTAILGGATTTLQTVAIIGAQTAIGNTLIPVAALTTTQAAGIFDEGWAAFEDTSAVATYLRRIKKQPALVHTTWVDAYLELYEPLPIQLETTDFVAMMTNPYKSIIQAVNGTLTGMALGGVCCPVTAAYYCWVQTRGWFGCHIKDGVLVVGTDVQIGATTAGTPTSMTELLFGSSFGRTSGAWADEGAGILYLMCE
jgi:hypothetical protein